MCFWSFLVKSATEILSIIIIIIIIKAFRDFNNIDIDIEIQEGAIM